MNGIVWRQWLHGLCVFALLLVWSVDPVHAQVELVTYDDTPVAGISATQADGASWLVTIEVPGLTRRIFDTIHTTLVKPVADASADTLCNMDVTITPRRARLVLVCPADPSTLDRVVDLLVKRYGSSVVTTTANTPVHSTRNRIVTKVATTPTATIPHVRASSMTQSGVSWALDRIDSRANAYDGLYTYDSTCANVDVWTVDTGVYEASAEFGGRAKNEVNYAGGPNTDCQGHGTFVAGLIGGTTYGVCKAVRIRAVKALNCNGDGSVASVIRALDYIDAMRDPLRATVINLSLQADFDAGMNTQINDMVLNSGIAIVAAAGNSGSLASDYSPASAIRALTVAATDRNDVMADFSNYGAFIDIAAPGVDVLSAGKNSPMGVAEGSGTSFAAPIVAGTVALLWTIEPDKRAASRVMAAVVANATSNVVTQTRGTAVKLVFTRLGTTAPMPPPSPTVWKPKPFPPSQKRPPPAKSLANPVPPIQNDTPPRHQPLMIHCVVVASLIANMVMALVI